MGDSPPSFPYAESQLAGPSQSRPSLVDEKVDAALVNGDEEPYTIKCICGFPDDDGNTVLCEQCNTWQHIECYYPGSVVPEVHNCADCIPRTLDATGAAFRQKQLRDHMKLSDDRKAKRPNQKSHKKSRTKDINTVTVQTNGWSGDKDGSFGSDRKRISPRDQHPSGKRPKTSHRNSGSIAQDSQRPPNNRNRSGSNVATAQSPTKSPPLELPPDFYSPEFIRVHQMNTSFVPAQTNLFLDIGVTNLLTNCLDDPEATAAVTNGKSAADFLKKVQQPIEELFVPVHKEVLEDKNQWFHGSHPKWPYLIVERDVPENGLIGELKGHIGHRDTYKKEAANRWETLRHPDHFVFFHPSLPIYIDARTEGTELRYVRRSCRPNSRIETFITAGREYRFCIQATTDLMTGAEVTIPWNTETHQECLSRINSKLATEAEREYLSGWVEGLLANFGGCACKDTTGHDQECLMERFDRRTNNRSPMINGQSTRPIKSKKGRKRSSPGFGHAANSRASSEALIRGDFDDDADETRSTTQSSRSRNSRDVSPSAHMAHDGLENSLSERDKRKLQQQEKLFEQLEQEAKQGSRKKNRSSGSNLNTPSLSSSNRLGHHSSGSNPTTPAPFARSRNNDNKSYYGSPTLQYSNGRSPPVSAFAMPQNSRTKPDTNHGRERPRYVDSSTQTPPESEDLYGISRSPSTRRRSYVSLTQRLLKRSHLARVATAATNQTAVAAISPNSPDSKAAVNASSNNPPDGQVLGYMPSMGLLKIVTSGDDMDVDQRIDSAAPDTADKTLASAVTSTTQTPLKSPHPLIKPPPPPWPSSDQTGGPDSSSKPTVIPQPEFSSDGNRHTNRTIGLHVDLPPPPRFGSTAPSDGVLTATPGTMSSGISPSPMASEPGLLQGLPPLTSPSVPGSNSITQPSPVKKKMSLSDYMKKQKVETPSTEKPPRLGSVQAGSSPSSIKEEPVAPSGDSADLVMGEASSEAAAEVSNPPN